MPTYLVDQAIGLLGLGWLDTFLAWSAVVALIVILIEGCRKV